MITFLKLDLVGYETGRISAASVAARGMWIDMLCVAARTDSWERVPAGARYWAKRSGTSVEEAKALLDELVEVESIRLDGNEFILYGVEAIQESLMKKRFDDRRRQAKKRAAEKEVEGGEPTTAAAVREGLWRSLDAFIPEDMDIDESLDRYRRSYEDAIAKGSEGGKYASVKGVGPASLANVVVNHAAARWLGVDVNDTGSIRRLAALRNVYGPSVIDCMPLAAAKANKDVISYLEAILKKGGDR